MTQPAPAVSSQAAYMLGQAVKRSKRTSGIQLPLGFVRSGTAGEVAVGDAHTYNLGGCGVLL